MNAFGYTILNLWLMIIEVQIGLSWSTTTTTSLSQNLTLECNKGGCNEVYDENERACEGPIDEVTTVTCEVPEEVCYKTESLYRDSMTIEFGCQSECKPANIETKKMKRKTICCTTDLCNVNEADEPDNSATSVTSSTFAIVYHVALLGLNILKPF